MTTVNLFRFLIAPALLIYQSIFLALGQIWANKLRSLLTTIGIIIGVASVTAVIAALTGMKQNVLATFESYGANKIYILPWVIDDDARRLYQSQDLRFHVHVFDNVLEHCPSVANITKMYFTSRNISHGTHVEPNIEIQGIEPTWHVIENRSVVIGRPFSLIDNTQGRAVCLINDKAQQIFALNADPTGQDLIIGSRRYIIVGVVESHADSSMFGEGANDIEVFVPFNTEYAPRRYIHAIAASRSPDVSDEAQAELRFYLRYKRHVGVGKPDNFRLEVVQKYVNEFKSLATAVTMVASGIVGISLLVGGVGIMNIMLVSVSERTREIGLRKAVGARPAAILLQFLVEAMVLCLLGGLVGLIGGEGITAILKSIPGAKLEKAMVPGWAVALSFGFAAIVGLVFGMFPAIKAARLDPIDALRHE